MKKAQANPAEPAYIEGEVILAVESGDNGLKKSGVDTEKELLAQDLCRQYVSKVSYLTTVQKPEQTPEDQAEGMTAEAQAAKDQIAEDQTAKVSGKSTVGDKSERKQASGKLSASSGKKLDFYVGTLTEDTDVDTAVEALRRQEGIFWAEPNYVCHIMDEPSYPFEADELASGQWYIDEIQAKEAWSLLEKEGNAPGKGVTVAVIDTGVSLAHSDLINNIWVNEAEQEGEEGVDDDGNGYVDDIHGANLVNLSPEMRDKNGHGTMMAGIIAMEAGNGGGAGISYGARIMPVKVSIDGNFGTDVAAEGIEYAVDNGADVINMSFAAYEDSLLLQSVIEKASQKCLLAAASGNEGMVTEDVAIEGTEAANAYPAAYDNVVGVMAHDPSGDISDFSNWDTAVGMGAEYEVAAPGEMIYSTSLNDRYQYVSGTSPATAVVAGAMAVCRGIFADREKYPAPALQKMFVESMDHKLDWSYGSAVKLSYRKLNLMDITAMAQQEELIADREPPEAEDQTPSPQSGREFTFRVKASDAFGIKKATLYYRTAEGQEWFAEEMEEIYGGIYQLSIPREDQHTQEIFYYFDIYDGVYHTKVGDAYAPMKLILYGTAGSAESPEPGGTADVTPGAGDADAGSGNTGAGAADTGTPGTGGADGGNTAAGVAGAGSGNTGAGVADAGTPGTGDAAGGAGAGGTDAGESSAGTISAKKLRQFQKTAPVVKRRYKKGRKKAKLSFQAGIKIKVSRYCVYRADKKKGKYRLIAKVKKPSFSVRVTKKKKYYRVSARVQKDGQVYKSKKSEVVICFR